MTPSQFTKHALALWRTDPPPHAASVLHAALGLVLELQEYAAARTPENQLEELGDILFYLHILWNEIGYSEPNTHSFIQTRDLSPIEAVHNAAEAAKRYAVYHTHEKDAVLRKALFDALRDLSDKLEHDFNPDELDDARAANGRKLAARYPAGFDPLKAVDRDLTLEAKALEKTYENNDE